MIKGLLDQVIVPNLVVDEFATEIARKNAENSVKPYEITIHKGDKIVFEGEPVTRLKRDALRQAGYNVYELNWQGLLAIYVLVFIGTSIFLTYMKFFEKQFLEPRYLMITSVLSIMLGCNCSCNAYWIFPLCFTYTGLCFASCYFHKSKDCILAINGSFNCFNYWGPI